MRRLVLCTVLVAVLGVATTLGIAVAQPFFASDTGNSTQVYHLFVREGRALSCVEIRSFCHTVQVCTDFTPADAGKTAEKAIRDRWAEVEPRIALVPDRRMSADPPAWGSLASASTLPARFCQDVGYGWPTVALWWREYRPGMNGMDIGPSTLEGALSWKGGAPARIAGDPPLPGIPNWPGLLIGAAFWGAVWSPLVCAIPLRRALRLRRGLCPACAYDNRGLPPNSPCPECGSPAVHLP